MFIYFTLIVLKKELENITIYLEHKNEKIECKICYQQQLFQDQNYLQIIYCTNVDTDDFKIKYYLKNKINKVENYICEKKIYCYFNSINIIFDNFQINDSYEFSLDFIDIYDCYYNFSKFSNDKGFQKELFNSGFKELKKIKSKYSINFLFQIISFVSNDYEKLFEILIYLDINLIKDTFLNSNVKPIFKELLDKRDIYIYKANHQIGLKFDTLLLFGYLFQKDINIAINFIIKSPHRNSLIGLLQDNLGNFNDIYEQEMLCFLLKNCKFETILFKILRRLDKYILTQTNFFEKNYSNLKLFIDISSIPMNSNIKNSKYYQSSSKTFQLIIYKIKNLELTYYELNQLWKLLQLESKEKIKILTINFTPNFLEEMNL